MSMPLYKLSAEYQEKLEWLINGSDLPEETILDTVESLSGELNLKMKNVGAFILNLEADAKAVEEAAKRMKERADGLKKKHAFLVDYLLDNMAKAGITEISCDEFLLKLGECPPSLIIDDEEKIPAIFVNAEIIKKVDKKAIKEAIVDGEKIPGCHIEKNKRLIIK